jgi:hypothetical protein
MTAPAEIARANPGFSRRGPNMSRPQNAHARQRRVARLFDVFRHRDCAISYSARSITGWLERRLDRHSAPRTTPLMRWARRISRRHCLGAKAENCAPNPERLELTRFREVTMNMSEYEERFRSQMPSLHQVIAAAREPDRGRRRSRRLRIAAASLRVMAMTCKVASHYTLHSSRRDGLRAWKSGIR